MSGSSLTRFSVGRAHRRPPRAAASTAGRTLAALTVLLMPLGLLSAPGAVAQPAPVGQGFNLNAADLDFILRQIRISEQHSATLSPENPCGTLLGPGPDQIPNGGTNGDTLPLGLRTVDGTCNNLVAGQNEFGAADTAFPRRVPGVFADAENLVSDPDGPNRGQAVGDATSYTQKSGFVQDSEPRIVSNLIVDQTRTNPAAVAAAGGPDVVADPSGTLSVPNVAPDVGLSAPFNSWFTLFGQFFDHGLDLTGKSGGAVFVPLQADDPLIVGPDGVPGTGDDPAPGSPRFVPPEQRFMLLTRSTNQPGTDGRLGTADDVQDASNLTTSFVDQNQTYTSNPSHQAFLREYADGVAGAPVTPVSTGRLITGPGGGMGDWTAVKAQAAAMLGFVLRDGDVFNVPMLATDPYGRFLPGPNGLPQLVTPAGLLEGNPATPVAIPADAARTGHAFLDDIAHQANPFNRNGQLLVADADTSINEDRDPATYDDEMLGRHFVAGDGRVNENIALTAVHHVFHAEHNRVALDINAMLTADQARATQWQQAGPSGWGYGERLFQAAKLVTEMEYQHLVFEEFARKVQPLVNPFGEGGTGYKTNLDPSIKAEFAHAVYRFGHSMLDDTVARTNADGSNNDIGLIPAFLNPPEFYDGGPAGVLNPEQAAGSIVRGLTRQVGQEIDEFVIEALRNNLLGLPLDLATLNIARARETGTPTLNAARKVFFEESANTALTPYTSWTDFGFNLKNRESLENFIAAYGTHPSITGNLAQRREAARLLILSDTEGTPGSAADPTTNPPTPASEPIEPQSPPDSIDFMNSTGAYANTADGANTAGVDAIDLWVGGLAEKKMVFGGMLGATFNYVFELQMEDLQFGDRFYYLSRTAGLNLGVQLEGNSFAELIQRNTDVGVLPADVFSRPDYIFNLDQLGTTGAIPDDPSTADYNEGDRTKEPGIDLSRAPDGTIRYSGPAHVVFNGTPSFDRVTSSEGDDTIRGNDADDRIEGGDGNDNIVGGLGDDILTDVAGDDTLKGGDGNDAISSGQGFGGDLNQGGRGKDFIVGGNDLTTTIAGPDDDIVFAGAGDDTVFGDEGNDWIEGGGGAFNLLQGDAGAPFADDPNGGHDVLIGYGGEQDYDSEGGDDIMLIGPGIQRAEGMLGFDYATNYLNNAPADSDISITGLLPPSLETLKDRFDLVEALSGWQFNDVLRGDNRIAGPEGENPEGTITPSHALTADGVARVPGLAAVLGTAAVPFSAGNILLGGAGADVIEGRGGDDIIDGDRWLRVQMSAPNPATADPADRKLVDTIGQLQVDVFAGRIKPGDIEIVRTVETAPAGTAVDVAEFSGNRAEYVVTRNTDGTVTVAHTGGTATDGTDTLRNVERLRFLDVTEDAAEAVNTPASGAPVVAFGQNTTVTPNVARLSPQENIAVPAVDTSGITDPDGLGPFTFQWSQRAVGSTAAPLPIAGATAATFTPTQAVVGRLLSVRVSFTDGKGKPESVVSADTPPVGDLFPGTTAADNFAGGAGEDLVSGLAGNDILGTGAGNDVVAGGTGDDNINAGLGDDIIRFTGTGAGSEIVDGGAGVDRIEATQATTTIGLSSVAGVETISGRGFASVSVFGSGAANIFDFSAMALDGLFSIDGGAGNDRLTFPDSGNRVFGGTGDDIIDGRGGTDILDGGAGNDTVTGGTGNDTIGVSSGNDVLVVEPGFGADTVTSFDANALDGQDRINVRALGITAANFGARVTFASNNSGGTLITLRTSTGTAGTISVGGVSPSGNWSTSDFIF